MNIDITSRRAAAELVRQLASGRLTNDEFEERWPASADPALSAVREAAWFLYSDLRAYRLTGANRLPFAVRRQLSRWVIFLQSDLEYEWPVATRTEKLARSIAGLLTMGVATRLWKTALQVSEDADVWPFIRRVDFRRALRAPRLLRRGMWGQPHCATRRARTFAPEMSWTTTVSEPKSSSWRLTSPLRQTANGTSARTAPE